MSIFRKKIKEQLKRIVITFVQGSDEIQPLTIDIGKNQKVSQDTCGNNIYIYENKKLIRTIHPRAGYTTITNLIYE